MSHEMEPFHAYLRELLDAFANREIEEVANPDGVKSTALRVSGFSHFVELSTKFIIANGFAQREAFKAMDQDDPSIFGSLAHLRKIFREDADRRYQQRLKEEQVRLSRNRSVHTHDQPPRNAMDPALKKNLIEELRSAPQGRTPEEAARQAAEEVIRIMRKDR